ncbi:MAG: hypothetical protein AAB250_05090, partial [Bdellovibrionota bacterium]
RFRVDPAAREGVDFKRVWEQGDYIIFLNKRALKVIPESLNVDIVGYFQILDSIDRSDRGMLEKLKRRLNNRIRIVSEAQIDQILEIIMSRAKAAPQLANQPADPVLQEWLSNPLSLRRPQFNRELIQTRAGFATVQAGFGTYSEEVRGGMIDLLIEINTAESRENVKALLTYQSVLEKHPKFDGWLRYLTTDPESFRKIALSPGQVANHEVDWFWQMKLPDGKTVLETWIASHSYFESAKALDVLSRPLFADDVRLFDLLIDNKMSNLGFQNSEGNKHLDAFIAKLLKFEQSDKSFERWYRIMDKLLDGGVQSITALIGAMSKVAPMSRVYGPGFETLLRGTLDRTKSSPLHATVRTALGAASLRVFPTGRIDLAMELAGNSRSWKMFGAVLDLPINAETKPIITKGFARLRARGQDGYDSSLGVETGEQIAGFFRRNSRMSVADGAKWLSDLAMLNPEFAGKILGEKNPKDWEPALRVILEPLTDALTGGWSQSRESYGTVIRHVFENEAWRDHDLVLRLVKRLMAEDKSVSVWMNKLESFIWIFRNEEWLKHSRLLRELMALHPQLAAKIGWNIVSDATWNSTHPELFYDLIREYEKHPSWREEIGKSIFFSLEYKAIDPEMLFTAIREKTLTDQQLATVLRKDGPWRNHPAVREKIRANGLSPYRWILTPKGLTKAVTRADAMKPQTNAQMPKLRCEHVFGGR